MPTLFKMSDDRKNDDVPAVVFTEQQVKASPRKTKKYVIIAVSGILAAAVILTAILVGMYIFTKAQMEIVQYTMQLGEKSKQDVTSDPNENVVQYHVSSPGHDAYIVNDFNKDLQLVKIVSEGNTNCYLSALNRTNAMDPSKINGPDTVDPKEAVSLIYQTADTPIPDTSFLGKTARETCKGISVYWLYPYCDNGDVNKATNNTNGDHLNRKRRGDAGYYCTNTVSYGGYSVPCVTGCCKKVCACKVNFYWQASNGQIQCKWTTSACSPQITANPVVYDSNCRGASYSSCPSATHSCGCA